VRVRRALGMAIDVDAIIRYVLHGQGRRSSGPFYAHTRFHDPETPLLPFDPNGAAELLRQAGYRKNAAGWFEKDGRVLEFTLVTNNGNPQRKMIATIAQEAWTRLGVRCAVQTFEWAVFLRNILESRQFDAIVLGWIGADLSPDRYEIWHSSRSSSNGQNAIGYANPEADRLMEAIRSEYDPEQQVRLARALHRTIAADHPYTFLYEPVISLAIGRDIVMPDFEHPGRLVPAQASPAGEPYYYLNDWRRRAASGTQPMQ
jgi:ABC-type transport system substrate-binding protein